MNTHRYLSEFLGTFALVATVVGSGIMAENLAGGNAAIALLGNTIATGAILYVLITIFAPISGAHFNPAVTLVMLALRELSLMGSILYISAQIAGGLCGTFLAHFMFEQEILQLSGNERSGLAQYGSEVIATIGLVLTILLGRKFRADQVAMLVGLYITAAYWFTSSTSFANPAVTIARTFSDSFSGISISDTPYFIVAQMIGAFMALLLSQTLLKSAR